MAKIRLGALAGQVSGSIGSQTYSHNRFGTYIRNRATPVQPDSALQLQRRAAMAQHSSDWQALTAAQRLSWKSWAENNPIVDTLGDKRIMTGHMAFVQINSRLSCVPAAAINAPPISAAPDPFLTCTVAASVATQNVVITFTAAPCAANHTIWISAAKTPTASINYINNLLRFIEAGGGAAASPHTCGALATKLGALVLGETIIVRCCQINYTTGLISPPREARCLVEA